MYYSGDKKFYTKYDALKHHNSTGENVFFYYYDDVYDKLDWTIEPPETLDFYYKEQAQRIRDSYDYVILCFSGGVDSTNILNTFHYNNLKIDKIVTAGAFSQDSHSMVEENHNGEIYFEAHPYLLGNQLSWVDIAIFPFIRQFSMVNPQEFEKLPLPHLKCWLAERLESALFQSVMEKYPTWVE